jgi:hypothetical protein
VGGFGQPIARYFAEKSPFATLRPIPAALGFHRRWRLKFCAVALVQTRVRYEMLCRCAVSLLSIGIRQRVLRSIV